MRFGTDTLHLDKDTMTRDGPITISETSPQQLKTLMIQWLADDPMARRYKQTFSIRLEVSASARQLDDAIDACYNDEMLEKATMQIGR